MIIHTHTLHGNSLWQFSNIFILPNLRVLNSPVRTTQSSLIGALPWLFSVYLCVCVWLPVVFRPKTTWSSTYLLRLGDRWQQETRVQRNRKMDELWGGAGVTEKLVLLGLLISFSATCCVSHIWEDTVLVAFVNAASVCIRDMVCRLFRAPGCSLISSDVIMCFILSQHSW